MTKERGRKVPELHDDDPKRVTTQRVAVDEIDNDQGFSLGALAWGQVTTMTPPRGKRYRTAAAVTEALSFRSETR